MLDLSVLSDDELTEKLQALAADERCCLSQLLAHLGEFATRRIHEDKGYSKSFHYCTKVLGYSEDAAWRRVCAARAARDFPSILSKLHKGEITLTAIVMLSRYLTSENHRRLLDQARGRSKREIETIIAEMAPQPERADCVRHLPGPASHEHPTDRTQGDLLAFPGQPVSPASQETQVSPVQPGLLAASDGVGSALPLPARAIPESIHSVAPSRVRFAFTGSEAFLLKIERAKQLLKHKYPAGHLENIFDEALEVLLNYKDPDRRRRRKQALRRLPSPMCSLEEKRRIPQRVKDEVWERDGGQCAFAAKDGTRCAEKGGLEFDHIVPFALGGLSHDPKNIRLLCRAHNQMMARRVFGEAAGPGIKTPRWRGEGDENA